MKKFSKTKIVVTFGPPCDSASVIKKMFRLGVRVFRFNMKHNTLKWHEGKIRFLKKTVQAFGENVCVLIDLQGPEVRATTTKKFFKKGEKVILSTKKPADILIDKKEAVRSIGQNNNLFIDDGRLKFKIVDKIKDKIVLKVIEGGILDGRKSVNFPGADLNIKSLARYDLECLDLGGQLQVDYVAFSFVRDKKDILDLKKELDKRKMAAGIIAKIETRKALDNFSEILKESDGIMVARGDLGIEMPMEQIPYWQKIIIRKCLEKGKPVITATQMLESMVDSPLPTRAEISDVGNAVLDKSDALMLSGETAVGKHPVEAVEWMIRSALFLEDNRELSDNRADFSIKKETASITKAALELTENLKVKGFLVLTESGFTVRTLARFRPKCPIFAFTHTVSVRNKLHLVWGVKPFVFNFHKLGEEDIKRILDFLKKKNEVKIGDKLVMVCGTKWGIPGKTDMVRVLEV